MAITESAGKLTEANVAIKVKTTNKNKFESELAAFKHAEKQLEALGVNKTTLKKSLTW